MKRAIIAIVLISLIAMGTRGFAHKNGSALVFRSDSEYRIHEASRVLNGMAPVTSVHAMTRRELNFYSGAEDVDSPKPVSWNVDLTVMPYAAVYSSPYDEIGERYPVDLYYMSMSMSPLFRILGGLGLEDYFYCATAFEIVPDRFALSGDGWYGPHDGSYYGMGESPAEHYVSFSTRHLSVTAGRFASGIGQGFLGNTFQNGRAPFYDQVQMVVYTSRLRLYYMLGTSNAHLFDDELEVQNNSGYYSNDEYEADHVKIFVYHRVEYRPVGNLLLGLGAMNLFGGKTPDLSEVAPLGIYHNAYDPEHRAYMAVIDATLAPARGVLVYGEILLNEMRLPGEKNTDPTAMGQQLGSRVVFKSGDGLIHTLGLEAAHIDPWTYIDYVPYASMYQRVAGRSHYYDVPLGYAYGGDLIHYGLMYRVISSGGLEIEIRLHRLHKGEKGMGLDEDGASYYTGSKKYLFWPSGTVELRNSVDLSVAVPLSGRLRFSCTGYYSYIQAFEHRRGRDVNLLIGQIGIGWVL